MTLKDQRYRFLISPDKVDARWCNPIEIPRFYAGWADHTDTPEKEFIEFLQSPVDTVSEHP